jgi:hypothetical protein
MEGTEPTARRPATSRFTVERRFEDRFEHGPEGLEGRRVVYGERFVRSSVKLDRSPFVLQRGATLRLLKHGLARILRPVGRSLLLAPVAWVLALGARYLGLPSGWVVVALVVWTCVFFAILNLYVWVAMLAHFRGKKARVERPFDESGADRLGLLPPPQQAIVGRVAALAPNDASEIWRECWLTDTGLFRRACGGDHFVIVPDDGRPPIVCRILGPPILVGPSATTSVDDPAVRQLLPDTVSEAPVEEVVLRVGDAVALYPRDLEELPRVDHVELDGPVRGYRPGGSLDAPYRGGGPNPGLLTTSHREAPLHIRKLR